MAFVLYGHSINLNYLFITFVICARWTGAIHYPHIKLSDHPSVRISSIAKQLMSFPYSDIISHKLSFALRSVAEDM